MRGNLNIETTEPPKIVALAKRLVVKMIKQITKRARSSTTNYSMSNVSGLFLLEVLPVFPSSKAVPLFFH